MVHEASWDEDFGNEDDVPLTELIQKISDHLNLPEPMIAAEYRSLDCEAPCTEELSPDWEATMIKEYKDMDSQAEDTAAVSDDDDDVEDNIPIPTSRQAISHLEHLRQFAAFHGKTDMLTKLLDMEEEIKVQPRQRLMSEFLS